MATEGGENEERGNWAGRLDFILSLIGYSVGLSNLWRFPSLCYRNGGGAFLIPYLIAMVICGMPFFFMELAWGQFCSEGPITAWKLCPLFRGVGFIMVIISSITIVYYNIVIGYSVLYLFSSFTSSVPWSGCDNWWNTNACTLRESGVNDIFTDNTLDITNTSEALNLTLAVRVSPAQQYWENYVLNISDGIDNLGSVQWKLVLCLLLSWIVVVLCLIKGVLTSGRVVYFTATFPYFVITILLIRGVTLPGSANGLMYFLIPKWEALLIPKVWSDAFTQIFYSLGPGWGALLTMASYNRFHHNFLKDALIVPLVNSGTSIYGGLAIFSIIGFMAHDQDQPIDKVVTSGPGLVFVAYPEALARIPLAPLWSILFFFMLITLGLDSQFGLVEGIASGIMDSFPDLFRKQKTLLIICICSVSFLLGLPLVTKGGIYIFTLLDWYTGLLSVFVIALFESLVIGWIYGANQFYDDIAMMLGSRPSPWWMICWMVISPLAIMFIAMMSYINYVPVYYDGYVYPKSAEVIGLVIMISPTLMIPLMMAYEYCVNGRGNDVLERMQALLKPTADWGPALPKYRYGDYYVELDGKSTANYPMTEFTTERANCEMPSEFNDNSSYPTKPIY
ncbi:sodium- and chloride-dependent glycine transporter 1-like [Saccoglossus kowalevskii]